MSFFVVMVNSSVCFGWKLGLVAVALLPVFVASGYFRFSLLNKLNYQLRAAYENSAQIACEQVAAIRTVASLNREVALHAEFRASLRAPVRKALYSTLKSTFVSSFLDGVDDRCLQWVKAQGFLRML
jgi:ATP-binding cassette, subfamily B (MDR/TAP), member 1